MDGAASHLLEPNDIHKLCIIRFECLAPVSKYQPLQDRKACPPQKAPITSYCICTTNMGKDGAALKCMGPAISISFACSGLSVLRQYRSTNHYRIGRHAPPQRAPITSNCICTTKTGKDGAALHLIEPTNIHQLWIFRFLCFASVSKYQTLQDRKACPPNEPTT
jgi:hypothetical protein